LWYKQEGEVADTVNIHSAKVRHPKATRLDLAQTLEVEESETIQLEKAIRHLKLEATMEALGFVSTVQRLERELASRPPTHVPAIVHDSITSTFPGHANCVDRENLHLQAPREARNYSDYKALHQYPSNTGKVSPKNYGLNRHWYLRPCYFMSRTNGQYQDSDYEWRYTVLTAKERAYIATPEPKGPQFLERHDCSTGLDHR
jgi:hypothetical protein